MILLFSIGTFCVSNIIKEANITANEVAIAVVNKYIPIVFVPSLPNMDVSFIEIIPDITETKIKGKTIILSKIKNKSPMVARMFSIMKLIKMLSTKKIFIIGERTIYKLFFNYAHYLHITNIQIIKEGINEFFPIKNNEIELNFKLKNTHKLCEDAIYTYWEKI